MKQIINIRYVGEKTTGETAFSPTTNLTWYPGDVHPIPAAIAQRMLQHPDVFQDADNPKKTPQALAAEQAAAQAAMPKAGTFNLMDLLPPGAKITLPDGTAIEIPGAPVVQAEGQLLRTAGSVGVESVLGDPNAVDPTSLNYADPRAQRMASLTGTAGDSAFGDDAVVQETKVGSAAGDGISLAPGAVVSPQTIDSSQIATATATAPAAKPAPAPTSAPAPAPATTRKKQG